ncbi:MAG: hypothetical protein HC820_07775, partial [Hydrococcus sp. RM1_1_31]|nr:hypothetical protein [Hydrococcus sp. RM1_1_31]
ELGEPMTLAEFRAVFSGSLIGNCGYTQETAEEAIRDGHTDLIAFGRPFISNPDLVDRFANSWPLNPPAETQVWYSFDREGYVDFPVYQEDDKKRDRRLGDRDRFNIPIANSPIPIHQSKRSLSSSTKR